MVSGTTTNSPQTQLAANVLAALESLDADKVVSYFSDDFEHHMLPKSHDGTVRSKQDLHVAQKYGLSTLKYVKFTVSETIEAPGRVVLHASSEGESNLGNAYTNEYVFIFHFSKNDDDELKIKTWKEFVDSKFMQEFIQKEQAAATATTK